MRFADALAYLEAERTKTPALSSATLEAEYRYMPESVQYRVVLPDGILSPPAPYRIAEPDPVPTPGPTAGKLWDAVCAWEPWPGGSKSSWEAVFKWSNYFSLIFVPLGVLRGRTLCALQTGWPVDEDVEFPLGRLYEPEDGDPTARWYGDQRTMAVRYAGGDEPCGEDQIMDKGGPVLRRLVVLGWLLINVDRKPDWDGEVGEEWVKTGHLLVIDVDRGRECHPWLVLAREFEERTEFKWELDLDYGARPAKRVRKRGFGRLGHSTTNQYPDASTLGTFPDDEDRTTIARFTHSLKRKGKAQSAKPFVKHFRKDFEFDLVGFGQDRSDTGPEWGPDLAEVMHWCCLDSEERMEVCYTEAGEEYMRYDQRTGQYTMSKTAGVQALIGDIDEELKVSDPLEARFRSANINL